jgi:hypothetical protein
MSVRKKSVLGLVAACVLAMPGTAFAGPLSGTCNSTTDGTAGGTGLNGTVHGGVCKTAT